MRVYAKISVQFDNKVVMPVTAVDVSADSEGKAIDEPRRWASKAAARELEISPSNLDQMIRKGEGEVTREGRRVYVRMHGPEYLSDDELLRRTIMERTSLNGACKNWSGAHRS